MKTLFISLVLLSLLFGCVSSEGTVNPPKKISGISTMVGNEPFSRIAILVENSEVYLVEGSGIDIDLLKENQGKRFVVTYNNLRDSSNLSIIHIINAEKQ